MQKASSRVALGLMCGLAICCAVMYFTADAAEETTRMDLKTIEATIKEDAKYVPFQKVAVSDGPAMKSVSSEDVTKVGMILTNTPDGRMRLRKYLSNVEAEIAEEEAARKRDVAAVRAQMSRNFAFNKQARAKMEKFLLHKMAVNAKKCKDDLAKGMRYVQGKFAAAAALSNKRNNANVARSKKMRALIEKNKKEAAAHLARAVLVQQRAMDTLTAKTNARIASTNKHVAQNAAQIKENAKKARKELDHAVAKYDKKVAEARTEAKAGRSKLKAQLLAQDKSIRQWANNRMKVVIAKTAAQFRRVRAKMAADRLHADNALKVATTKMTSSLNAFKALNNKRFAKTVKDIAAAKAEATARVAAATRSFKVGLYKLSATIKDQVGKANARIDQLTVTVDKNKVAQAKVNANVNAEIKRMIKIGNQRYEQHLAKDKELHGIVVKNKEDTDKQLKAMKDHYMMELQAVRATMRKNRAHATHMLAKESAKLYAAIAKNEKEQMETNAALAAQTRRARLDIMDALNEAKDDFSQRIGALHKTVVNNDKKFEGKMDKLTGIVRADAVKNAQGRKELKVLMEANKNELKAAVRDAIHKGETRMAAAEKKLKNLNKKTEAALNLKITTDIAKLTKRANDQIEGLRLNSAEARKEMKKELLYAVRSMAEEAKKNLDDAVEVATAAFKFANAKEGAAEAKSAADRAAIGLKIKSDKYAAERQLKDAVFTMQRSLLALQTQTEKKIKKTNTRVDAYAAKLEKESKDVKKMMAAQLTTLKGKIASQRKNAAADIKAAGDVSTAGWNKVDSAIATSLEKMEKKSNDRFSKLYGDMAAQRAAIDKKLASAVSDINDSIAKQAALQDTRFQTSVKNIKAAKAQAAAQVKLARKAFATQIEASTAYIKNMENRLYGEVMVVSGEVTSFKAQQATVNRRTKAEINRIEKLMNDHHSDSTRARGKLRAILDENKRAAAEETAALDKLFKAKVASIRSEAASDAREAAKDLTVATEKMYESMADAQKENLYQNKLSNEAITKYSADSMAKIAATKKEFDSRLDTLTNVVAANHKKVEQGLQVLTGVQRNYEKVGKADRKLIREQNAAMNADMQKRISKAIQIGEARATKVAQEAREHLAGAKKSMLIEITNTVEEYADMMFKTIQGKHGKIADNYLSLKAYAITAQDDVDDMVAKGKGKTISSIGSLLQNIADLSDVKPAKAEGISPSSEIPLVFSSGTVKIDNSVNKINNLVNEFTTVANTIREQYPMGLGKYLLFKLEGAMTKKGALSVGRVHGKSGNFVMVDAHAVGLSSRLKSFEEIAVRMSSYESTLAKLTASLSGKKGKVIKPFYVKPPEYQGK
jgi:hypothetical protein